MRPASHRANDLTFLWIHKVLLLALTVLLLTGGAFASAAHASDGVPLVLGSPGTEAGPPPEMDFSNIETTEVEPLTEGRPESAPQRPRMRVQASPILSITVEGNSEVVSDHILSVVSSQVGAPMDQNRLTRDSDEIFELGFFSDVDYRIVDEISGSHVIFTVVENPAISAINFYGNTTYTEEQLREICFTQPGMIFNRVFFRNDLQRIKEKYQQDGYVMARVADVKIEGTAVNVYITEPKLGEIIDTQAEAGAAVVVCGSTGEASTLNDKEHLGAVGYAVKRAAGRVPVIAGTGSNDTRHAVELTTEACGLGADAVLVVTPYYNKTTQHGLVRHFSIIADAADKPVYV